METGRKGKNGNTGTSSSCHFLHYLLQKIKKNQDMLGKALDDRESQVKEGGTKCLGAGTAFLDMSAYENYLHMDDAFLPRTPWSRNTNPRKKSYNTGLKVTILRFLATGDCVR